MSRNTPDAGLTLDAALVANARVQLGQYRDYADKEQLYGMRPCHWCQVFSRQVALLLGLVTDIAERLQDHEDAHIHGS